MFAIGLDGGGTSTRACIIDGSCKILGIGRSGPSGVDSVSPEVTKSSITNAIKAAIADSGLEIEGFASIMAGLAGIVHENEKQYLKDLILSTGFCRDLNHITVENDMKIALAGGNILEPGISAIVGTGSVAYGKNKDGLEMKTGGWGYREGETGSSYELGINAIRALVRAYDGREEISPFTERIFSFLKLGAIEDITDLLYQKNMSRSEIAALAPIVTEFADMKNPKALEIVGHSTDELAHMIDTIYRKIFSPEEKINVVIIGSLGNSGGVFRDMLYSKVKNRSQNMNIMPARLEPVVGAALWALNNAGIGIDKAFIENNISDFMI